MEAFPSLTRKEFETAASRFIRAFDSCKGSSWRDAYLKMTEGEPALVIRRDLNAPDSEAHEVREDEAKDMEDQDDDEALIRKPWTQASVEYSILISSSYQVPVLYFSLRLESMSQGATKDLETLYWYLVPTRFQANVQAMGVMGGISRGYHPLSHIPISFIHPCNTADAMSKMVGDRKIDPTEYLLIWMGLVGSSVGLCADSELAEKLMKT